MNDVQESITRVLERLAVHRPDAPALHVPGRIPLRYRDLATQIHYVRERLTHWSCQPGDVVGAVLPSRPELAVAIATMPAGCSFAPLDPSLSADAYAELMTRLKLRAVVVPRGLDHPARAAARRLGVAEIDLAAIGDGPAGSFTLDVTSPHTHLPERTPLDSRVAYVITSSGTTGRRKLVPAEHSVMLRYAGAIADRLQCTADDVGLHIRPLYFGSGLRSGILNALLIGSAIVILPEGDIESAFASLDEYQPTFFSAGFAVFRTISRRLDHFTDAARRHRFRFMLSGAGALDPDAADRLEQAFGTPMLTGFSSTETSRISVDPLPPAVRKRGSAGLPLVNEVAVLAEDGEIRSRGASGEIIVRGPMVFRGYLDDPELNASSFLGDWFRSGDLGRIDEDGYVFVTGRIKEIINRGGEKISPTEIDLAMESVAGVSEAAAFGVPHPSLGEEVVAAVVCEAGAAVDEATVLHQVSEQLGARKTPRRLFFADALPHTDSGKVQRGRLRELFAQQSTAASATSPAARGPEATPAVALIERTLAGLWASALPGAKIERDDDFFLLGGDSLGGEQLLLQVKEVFGVDVPLEMLYGRAGSIAGMTKAIQTLRAQQNTRQTKPKRLKSRKKAVAGNEPDTRHGVIINVPPMPLAEMLERQRAFVRTWTGTRATPDSLIVSLNTQGTRPGLFFCLQSDKGLTQLARFLGPDQPVHGVRSGLRIMTYTDENVETLAEHYANEMIALQPHGPFVVGGNCQGARIARALALELRERGREVALLIMLEPRTFPRYNGRVALIFARESHLNPYARDGNPDALFHRSYPGGYTVDFATGLHAKTFFSNNVQSLVEILKRRLRELPASPAIEIVSVASVAGAVPATGSVATRARQWLERSRLRSGGAQPKSAPGGKDTPSIRKSTT